MSETNERTTETAKWYTHVRRVPVLLGVFSDGTKIPGGPYSVMQLASAVAFWFLARKSWGIWSVTGSGVIDLTLAAAAAWGVAIGVGKIDTKGRNPMRVIYGLTRAVTSPSTGTLGGTRFKLRTPHRLGGADRVHRSAPALTQKPAPTPLPSPSTSTEIEALPELIEPSPASLPPMTSVQQLLAASRKA